MKSDTYWFYIEPFVHIEITKSAYLLYNSLNFTYITGVYPEIKNMLTELTHNNSVIKISNNSIKDIKLKEFFEKVKMNYMGDYFPTSFSGAKPVQIAPNHEVIPKKIDVNMEVLHQADRYKLLEKLNKITLYINSEPTDKSLYDFSFNQFLCNINIGETYNELKYNKSEEILKSLYDSEISEINILGGNILKYSNLKLLTEYLNKLGKQTNYYFKYKDLLDTKKNETFQNISKESSILKVLVENSYSQKEIKIVNDYLLINNINTNFIFLITNKKDFNEAEKTINNLKIKNSQYLPLYIKGEFEFFKEAVFIDEVDIMGLENNQINIFQNQVINMLDFGSLLFMPDGNCYTNINSEPIGNIYNKSVYQLIYNCLTKQDKDWFLTRNKIEPCKKCMFNALCPPISNYERVIKQYNLCSVKI